MGALIFGLWTLPKDFVEALFRSLLDESVCADVSLRCDVGKLNLLQLKNFLNNGRRVEREAAIIPNATSTPDHAASGAVLL
jgi:hypothetical protein